MKIRHAYLLITPALVVFTACSGSKPAGGANVAADSNPPAPAVTPAVTPAAPAAADSSPVRKPATAPAGAPAPNTQAAPAAAASAAKPVGKPETGDHDIALKPKFRIDEKTGKIDTIKRP